MKENNKKMNLVLVLLTILVLVGLGIILVYSDFLIEKDYIYNFSCFIASIYKLKWGFLLYIIPFIILQFLISIKSYSNNKKRFLTILNLFSLIVIYLLLISDISTSFVHNTGGIDSKYFGLGFVWLVLIIIPIGIILIILGIVLLIKLISNIIKKNKVRIDYQYIKSFFIVVLTIIIFNTSVFLYHRYNINSAYIKVSQIINSKKSVYNKLDYIFKEVELLQVPSFRKDCDTCSIYDHKVIYFTMNGNDFDVDTIYVEIDNHKIYYIFDDFNNDRYTIITNENGNVDKIKGVKINKKNAQELINKVNKKMFKEILVDIKK